MLQATSSDMVTGYSTSITISSLALSSITLASDDTSPTAYFTFKITATLLDQSGGSWTDLTSLSITPTTGIVGSTDITATGGTGLFSLYGTTSGIILFTVKSGSVEATIQIEIMKLRLVIESITSTVFTM